MDFKDWYSKRSLRYLFLRAQNLLSRYRISSTQAIQRIDECVKGLADQGCALTFVVPGVVVQRNPLFFQHLRQIGTEIAVHGYHHVNLKAYPVKEACQQLVKAIEVFNNVGIEARGFRNPYFGYSDEFVHALSKGLFEYSSNQTIYYKDALNGFDNDRANLVVDTLHNLYKPQLSDLTISVPWTRPNLIEIPVCLPDDMELLDGLNLGPDEVANAWRNILIQTHEQGELFTLIFHPELASLLNHPLMEVLNYARSLQPQVWVARLCDISQWWSEKACFSAEVTPSSTGLRINFTCSSRATILVKGADLHGFGSSWDSSYQRLQETTLEIPAFPRPFLGLGPKTPQRIISFLREQGYLLDMTETAPACGIYLDESKLTVLDNDRLLIDAIESCPGPLVRFWRWPEGAKSALSITGDLDALSLMDYASRLFIR